MKTRIARHVAIYLLIALTSYGIGACRQNIMLNPTEDDLLVLNGCVVSAWRAWHARDQRARPAIGKYWESIGYTNGMGIPQIFLPGAGGFAIISIS